MNFVECGDKYGTPVVFIHGVAFGSWMWREHTQRLSKYRCILPILPGHGPESDDIDLSMDEQVEAMAALISKACGGRKKVYIVGHSFGAQLALHLACKHPELVEGVLAMSALMRSVPFAYRYLMKPFSPMLPTAFASTFVRRHAARAFEVTDPVMRHMFVSDLGRLGSSTFRSYTVTNQECRVPEKLGACSVPIVCVSGENEAPQMRASLTELCAANTETLSGYVLSGKNHFYPWTDASLTSELIEAWLSGQSIEISGSVSLAA